MTATISTPVTIQNMTSAYVSFTSHVLKAFDLWDQAEALTKKNKGEGLCGSSQCGMQVGGLDSVSRSQRDRQSLFLVPLLCFITKSQIFLEVCAVSLIPEAGSLPLALCLLTDVGIVVSA